MTQRTQKSNKHSGKLRTRAATSHKLKTYLRRVTVQQKKTVVLSQRKTIEHAPAIKQIMDNAESLSTTQYIFQGPGGLTKFMFQSPAEVAYKKARVIALDYGDHKSAMGVGVRVAERFEAIGKLDVAFEWAKISGNRKVLVRIGTKAANEYEHRADSFENNFLSNELLISNYRKAIEFASDSGNTELAKKIGIGAAKRYEAYGDLCVDNPVSSVIGLEFGYARAIRWAKACGDEDFASKVSNKVIGLYKDKNTVNMLSLAFVRVIGDREQEGLIRNILESKRQASKERMATAALSE
ncbi:MAG: hypothetical protein KGI06_05450 [Candidatus Micrarchaeota archaeon]|nr:hypothetical protein [Candidatus Micrarchaeota archaeon]